MGSKLFAVYIPDDLFNRLDEAVRLGGYRTKSELIRDAIRRRVEEIVAEVREK